ATPDARLAGCRERGGLVDLNDPGARALACLGCHVGAPADPARRQWFVAQLWAEVVLVLRMYVDPRYRISRTAQLVVPGLLLLFVANYFFFAVWLTVPVVSPVAERLFDVALAILLYKVLVRELNRYREVLDYLSRYGLR
ncbi:MAG: hypothetical protein K2P78_14965, partial [Gemmataceae bacterium]|nr:hypothetical protein [Gemmataceae bacterium]